jgi:hypothetical protein
MESTLCIFVGKQTHRLQDKREGKNKKKKEKEKESPAAAAYIFGKLKVCIYMGTLDCWTVPA